MVRFQVKFLPSCLLVSAGISFICLSNGTRALRIQHSGDLVCGWIFSVGIIHSFDLTSTHRLDNILIVVFKVKTFDKSFWFRPS